MVESATSSELAQVWNDLMARWCPSRRCPIRHSWTCSSRGWPPDGLWLFEATRPARSPRGQEALICRIAASPTTGLTHLPGPAQPISTRKP